MARTTKDRIHSLDMPIIDNAFAMESGYVLNFTDRTFAEFFAEELGVNIDDPRWEVQGCSKAKRLRFYLRRARPETALDTLNALWEYRETNSVTANYPELDDAVRAAFFRIVQRLGGQPRATEVPASLHSELRIEETVSSNLTSRLLEVSRLAPQARG